MRHVETDHDFESLAFPSPGEPEYVLLYGEVTLFVNGSHKRSVFTWSLHVDGTVNVWQNVPRVRFVGNDSALAYGGDAVAATLDIVARATA
jgi:hypothetical protein